MALGDRGGALEDSVSDSDDNEPTDIEKTFGGGDLGPSGDPEQQTGTSGRDDDDDDDDEPSGGGATFEGRERGGTGARDDDDDDDMPVQDEVERGDRPPQTGEPPEDDDQPMPAEQEAERGDMPRQTGPTGPTEEEGVEETGEQKPEPQGDIAEFGGDVSQEDIRQAIEEGKTIPSVEDKPAVAAALAEMGASDVRQYDLSEAVDVDLTPEGFETRVSERGIAQQLEEQVAAQREDIDSEDVAITGGLEEGFEAVFTEEAQTEQRAERAESLAEQVESPDFDITESQLRESTTGLFAGDQETTQDVQEGVAEQELETQLEERTGVDLQPEDIRFETVERDGQTVVEAELTREGRKTVEQETAFQGVTQDTPLEAPSEFLAGTKFEFEEFRRGTREAIDPERGERRERFFERIKPELPDVDVGPSDIEAKARKFATFGPDELLPETEASREVRGELTGGTLPVFSSAAGGGGLATGVRTATAGAATGTAILGGAAAFRGVDRDTPTARTGKIAIPESGQFFPQDEMALPDRNGSFVERDEILPPGAQEDLGRTGAPLEEIRPGEGIAPSGVGIGPPVTPTELGLPDARTAGGRGGFGPAQATPVGMQMGEGMLEEEEEEKTLITEEDILDEPITSDPTKDFISGESVTPGESAAGEKFGYGDVPASDLVSIPIDAPQTVADEEVFVGFGEGETGAVNEEVLNRSEAAMRSEVLQGEELLSEIDTAQSARQDVGPIGIGEQAARSGAMLESEAMQTGRLDQSLRTQPAEPQATVDMPQATPLETPRIDLPAFQYPELPRYEFPTPTLTPPDIPPSERQLRPGLPEGEADTDEDRRGRNALSDLFENIPDDVDAALEGLEFNE